MADSPDNRRKNVRVLGPFDGMRPGLFDLPLQIYDLSLGGCFVNSVHEAPQKGQVFPIHIDLPNGETSRRERGGGLRATRLRIRREILSDLSRESAADLNRRWNCCNGRKPRRDRFRQVPNVDRA